MLIPKSKFVDTIAPLIVAEGKKRGYSVYSTAIAQAVIESNYGQSKLSADYNNFFGLKCGSKWKGKSVNMKTKEEYKVGTLTTIKDNFRVYDSIEEGVAGYYDFISTKRYANLKEALTPLQYAQFLKADGYATSSSYVNTLYNCVCKLGLARYDAGVAALIKPSVQPVDEKARDLKVVAQEVIMGIYGNGNERKRKLAAAGYDYKEVQKLVNQMMRKG